VTRSANIVHRYDGPRRAQRTVARALPSRSFDLFVHFICTKEPSHGGQPRDRRKRAYVPTAA
jgi:hypothetical protein